MLAISNALAWLYKNIFFLKISFTCWKMQTMKKWIGSSGKKPYLFCEPTWTLHTFRPFGWIHLYLLCFLTFSPNCKSHPRFWGPTRVLRQLKMHFLSNHFNGFPETDCTNKIFVVFSLPDFRWARSPGSGKYKCSSTNKTKLSLGLQNIRIINQNWYH